MKAKRLFRDISHRIVIRWLSDRHVISRLVGYIDRRLRSAIPSRGHFIYENTQIVTKICEIILREKTHFIWKTDFLFAGSI